MAYGIPPGGDAGDWTYKPPKLSDPPDPPEQPPAPPVVVAPPAPPKKSEAGVPAEVTPASIGNQLLALLPDSAEALQIQDWILSNIVNITDAILLASGIDLNNLDATIGSCAETLESKYDELNSKNATPPGQGQPCPQLPGTCLDPTCRSLFDVNELAIRGRKSVTTKKYYAPVIFPGYRLVSDQKWAFGQKIEYDQEWRHEGFTLGSLISSFSLLPAEETTLEVSSWQRSKSEVQTETDSATKQSMETELKRTDEQTISNEASRQNGWSVSATGSVSFGPASASVTAGANGSSSDRAAIAQRGLQESTLKATSEVSSRRAIKITSTSESQSEQKSIRKLKNPNECHTVTYNFFQVVKLFDVQRRLRNDAPTLYFPGLFPATYSTGQPVRIPYELIEGFTSPSLFISQYFDVDRDISQEIHGIALRVRIDIRKKPSDALKALAAALAVAAKALLKVDPGQHLADLATFCRAYATETSKLRIAAVDGYGKKNGKSLGDSIEVNTAGVYVDSLLGRCSACEDSIVSRTFVNVTRLEADRAEVVAATELLKLEAVRRQKRLDAGNLDPFDPPAEAVA